MPQDLLALIRSKKAQIAKLESELAEARKLLVDGKGEARVAAPTVKASGTTTRHTAKKVPVAAPRTTAAEVRALPPDSSTARAVAVLREHDRVLSVGEIIQFIAVRFQHVVKKDTLVGNLSRYVKAKRLFYRAGPSAYGLLEWKERSKAS